MLKKLIVLLSLFTGLSACNKSTDLLFETVKPDSLGIDFTHINGHKNNYKYPELLVAGVASFDYDLDGDLDLYFVQSGDNGQTDQMYKSLVKETGDLKFINVTEELKLNSTAYGIGVSIGDYNNDGYPDIYISNWKQNTLLKNHKGQFFEDVTLDVNLKDDGNLSIISAFVDLNQDGWLDLVSLNNVNYNENYEPKCIMVMGNDYCGPSSFSYNKNDLYQNISGTFIKVDDKHSGMNLQLPSLAISIFDANQDGLSDIYIANDEQTNTLWVNQGEFKFKEQGLVSGIAVNNMAKVEASMGIAVGDVNHSGLLDIYLSHMWKETNTLYIQNEVLQFSDVTAQFKLAHSSFKHTGFGTSFIDFENDGDLDIVVANGSIHRIDGQLDYAEVNLFYENIHKEFTLLDNSKILSKNPKNNSRGLIRVDLDNDGDSDIIISNNNSKPEIYLNKNHKNNWIGYSARNESGHLLENIESIAQYDKKTIHNIQTRSGSYASSSDPRVLMGLGESNTNVNITIRWNTVEFELFENLIHNKYHTLIKGQGRAVVSWPRDLLISTNSKPAPINQDRLKSALNKLLKGSISIATKSHLTQLISNTTIDLCYSLQSYEFINETSFCYQKYLNPLDDMAANSYYLAALNEVNKFNYTKAHSYFDSATNMDPSNWLYCIRKTQAYYLNHDYTLAHTTLLQCKNLKIDVFNDKLEGDIYFAQEKYKQAFKMYRKVLSSRPELNHIYYQLADSLKHFQSKKLVNMALSHAGKVKLNLSDPILAHLVQYNIDPEFHHEKSLLANINQDFNTAIAAMSRAYALDEHNERIFNNYALLLAEVKQLKKAIQVMHHNQAYFNKPQSYLNYGTFLSRARTFEIAQTIYLKGLGFYPNNIDLLTNLANNHILLKQFKLAEKYYSQILVIDHNNENAIKGLELSKEPQTQFQ